MPPYSMKVKKYAKARTALQSFTSGPDFNKLKTFQESLDRAEGIEKLKGLKEKNEKKEKKSEMWRELMGKPPIPPTFMKKTSTVNSKPTTFSGPPVDQGKRKKNSLG